MNNTLIKTFSSIAVFILAFIVGNTFFSFSDKDNNMASVGEVLGINTVILQDSLNSYAGTEDSMLGPASAAYWTYTNLNLADPGGRNAVIKFNLSSLPADAQVSSAELSLYYYTDTSATEAVVSKIITLRKVLRSWSEATVTQSESAPGTAWTTIYARGNDTDRSGAVSDTQTWNTGEFGWKNWNATADVQSFVTTPGDNNGWVLDLTNTPYDVAFYASEYNTDKTLRPKLTITYTSSTDLPPPDVTAPVISAISVSNITSSGATVSWTTDESSDSQVSHSTDLNYGLSSVLDSSMVTSHSRTLTGLTANTTYNFVVKSRDASGNLSVSSNQTFLTTATTATPPPTPPSPPSTTPIQTSTAQPGTANLRNSSGITNYTLTPHPRIWFDGPSGSITNSVKNSSRASTANSLWVALKNQTDTLLAGNWRQYNTSYPPQKFAAAAIKAFVDGDQTAKEAAIWSLTHAEDMVGGSFGCTETDRYCSGRGGDLDYSRSDAAYLAQTYTLLRSQMTPEERQLFADKMLNDNEITRSGLNPIGQACTNQGMTLGTGTITSNGTTQIVGVGTSFTTEFQPGSIIWPAYLSASLYDIDPNIVAGRVISVQDDTHLTIHANWGARNSINFYYSRPWQSGDCGWIWFTKHHEVTPFSNPNYYPTTGGSGAPINPTNQAVNNLVLTALYGNIYVGLALADDDPRARTLLEQSYNYFYDYILPKKKNYYTGFNESGFQYGMGRQFNFTGGIVLAMQNSLQNGQNLSGGNFLKRALPYMYYSFLPWDAGGLTIAFAEGGGRYTDAVVMRGTYAQLILYPNSIESQLFNWWARNSWNAWNSPTVAGGAALPWMYLAFDPSLVSTPVSTQPTQYLFNDTDWAECASLGLSCDSKNQFGSVISRTGFSKAPTSDTLLFINAHDLNTDLDSHTGLISAGSYQLGKNGFLVSEDSVYGAGYAPNQKNTIQIGNDTTNFGFRSATGALIGDASIERWAGANPTGDSQSRYMYASVNLTGTYKSTANATRVLRQYVHFKKPTATDFVVIYDDVALSAGNAIKAFMHFQNPTRTTIDGVNKIVTSIGSSGRVNSKVLSPAGNVIITTDNASGTYTGGAGKTFRTTICPSTDGTTCSSQTTSLQSFTVHQPLSNTTGALPSIGLVSTDANSAGIEIGGADPKVAVFAKSGVDKNATSFTTTHSGTAQYLVSGLIPGRYDVKKDGVDLSSNNLVNFSDNSLYFESTKGAFQVFIVGSPLPPPVTATSTPPVIVPEVILPVISGIATPSVGTSTVTITWNTDVNTDTQVEYGLTTAYGSASVLKDTSTKVKTHTVIITSLTPGVRYNFRVKSRDSTNNLAISINQSFTTALVVGGVVVIPSIPVVPPPTNPTTGPVSQTANSSGTTASTNTQDTRSTSVTSITQTQNTLQKTSPISSNLSRGSKHPEVTSVQKFLISQSLLSSDSATGYFGPLTEAAVKAFQRKYNIVSTGSPSTTGYGSIGPRTRAKMNELLGLKNPSTDSTSSLKSSSGQVKLARPLYRGIKGTDVTSLQNVLIKEGLLSSDSNTGYFGPLTEAAVKAFQKKYNIVISGTPVSTGFGATGPKTRAKINEVGGY